MLGCFKVRMVEYRGVVVRLLKSNWLGLEGRTDLSDKLEIP